MGIQALAKKMYLNNTLRTFQRIFLSAPIFLKILGVGAIVSILFSVVFLYQIQISLVNYLYTDLRQRTLTTAYSISEILVNPVITGDFFNVYEITQKKVHDTPELLYITVFDHNGDMIANPSKQLLPDYLFANPKNNDVEIQVLKFQNNLIFDISTPILNGAAGILRIGVTDRQVQATISSISNTFLITVLLCTLVGQLLALFLSFVITRPISNLLETTNKIRVGDFCSRAKIFSTDEIGVLAGSVNHMAEALDDYHKMVEKKEIERVNLIEKIVNAQEDERKYLALELHDHFGQYLSSLILMVRSIYNNEKFSKADFEEIKSKINELIDDMRKMASGLRPSLLDDYGLDPALKHFLSETKRYSNIDIDYQYLDSGKLSRLPGIVEITLYRITQEAITNSIRHSDASYISVILMQNDKVTLIIEDNGTGFEIEKCKQEQKCCMGLISMRERAHLLNGEFLVETALGEGTTIKVTLHL